MLLIRRAQKVKINARILRVGFEFKNLAAENSHLNRAVIKGRVCSQRVSRAGCEIT